MPLILPRCVRPSPCHPLRRGGSTAASTTCLSPTARQRVRSKIHHRILLTSASSSAHATVAARPLPLSQFSSIIHRIRKPAAPGAATIMPQTSHIRSHMGHAHHHGHGHSHDNTYLTSKNKNDPGVRITRIGLYVNLGMAVGKGVGGYVFHSQALTADAVHALTDLVSDVMTLMTISYSIRPASTRFPLGYGKIESLGALAVSGILLSGGIMIGLQAIMALSQQFFPQIFEMLSPVLEHAHHHGHDHGELGPHINAAWLAAGSIVIKEWLYRATIKVAKEKRSSVLSSNAYHHRVDSLTAFVALFTILASQVMEGARWLDPVGGLIISGMIVQAGWGNTKSALYELADAGMDEDVILSAREATTGILAEISPDIQLRGIQGTKSGQNLMFEIEVAVPQGFTVARSNEVEVQLRENLAGKVRGTKRVIVRFTESKREPFADMFIHKETSEIMDQPLEEHHEHEHDDHDSHHHEPRTNASSTATQTNGSAQKRGK